jgi:FXSXX-COOH protein
VGDDLIDVGSVDATALSLAQVQALGDSALGHALRRMIEDRADAGPPAGREPVAAFTDCF